MHDLTAVGIHHTVRRALSGEPLPFELAPYAPARPDLTELTDLDGLSYAQVNAHLALKETPA